MTATLTRTTIPALALALLLLACPACTNAALWYQGVQNQQQINKYHKAVGTHAAAESLVGTWQFHLPPPDLTVKSFHDSDCSLSLFADHTFTLLVGPHTFLAPVHIRTGRWQNLGGGHILLTTHNGLPFTTPPTNLDLATIQNVFVMRNNQLLQEPLPPPTTAPIPITNY